MVRPTRCGRRSLAIVSTSGSSGTSERLGVAESADMRELDRNTGGASKLQTLSGADDRQLLHIGPVWSGLGLDLDPGLELVRAGHDARHGLGESLDLALRPLEQQLVMHLQQHSALDVARLDLALQ